MFWVCKYHREGKKGVSRRFDWLIWAACHAHLFELLLSTNMYVDHITRLVPFKLRQLDVTGGPSAPITVAWLRSFSLTMIHTHMYFARSLTH
ncbi:hypothetical protein Y032_0171g293 [Ancylostoma ceylanicum]|uniref:Uncharacterized protein n=1 Tax=Ancylostoma ceylanicum TaxID=53326 RepID=A0A016SVL1_9BILA|nr:hypothetical protein Y032_0171g293 [Ancylostoma ceylanicum]